MNILSFSNTKTTILRETWQKSAECDIEVDINPLNESVPVCADVIDGGKASELGRKVYPGDRWRYDKENFDAGSHQGERLGEGDSIVVRVGRKIEEFESTQMGGPTGGLCGRHMPLALRKRWQHGLLDSVSVALWGCYKMGTKTHGNLGKGDVIAVVSAFEE
ncbi:hypothetical protein U1Q18_029242 [Sarracenia purpurea var. burkii]